MKRGASLEGARRLKGRRRNFLVVLGCMVAFVTAFAFMVPAVTMTKGNLACGMEEHAHTKACYEQVLVCGQEEGEGTDPETGEGGHEHSKACYEKQLVCGLEEHKHTDACYEPEQPGDGLEAGESESDSDEGVEGDASADTESSDSADETAEQSAEVSDATEIENADNQSEDTGSGENGDASTETDRPAQTFNENLKKKDADGNEYVDIAVNVSAPEGAFPAGTTMKISRVKDTDIQSEVEQAVKDAKGENSVVKSMTAVNIVFLDAEGNEIEPATKVDVKISATGLQRIEEPVLVHVVDKEKPNQAEKPADAEVLQQVDVVNWDDADKTKGKEDTLKFAADEFSPYVIVEVETITADVLTANGETYTITVTYDEAAEIPEGSILEAHELTGDEYDKYLDDSAKQLGIARDDASLARFFDIKIIHDGQKIEPKVPVQVSIKHEDTLDVALGDTLNVVHFADAATEVIEGVELSDDRTEVSYEQGSFSVTGEIVSNPTAGSVENPNEYALVVKYDGKFYSVDSDGTLTPVTVDDPDNPTTVTIGAPMLWAYDSEGSIYHHADATDVNSGQTAADYYYKFIDINADNGIYEEAQIDISNMDATQRNYGEQVQNDDVILEVMESSYFTGGKKAWMVRLHKHKDSSTTIYNAATNKLTNNDGTRVLDVVLTDQGVLHLVSKPVSESDGVEVFFTNVSTSVPDVSPITTQ